MSAQRNVALDSAQLGRSIKRIAMEIAERNGGADNVVLVGIIRRGAKLAERIAAELRSNGKRPVLVGTLDISSYRDDGRGMPGDPRLIGRDIPFSLDGKRVVLVGIVRRGATLAERIADELRTNGKRQVPVGTLDISSYRDDGKGAPGDPRLIGRDIPFSLDSKRVVLVDDVLYTGRTVRAALDAISDLGRAESVQLAVLVDRGERELPIRADYVGKNIQAPDGQRVYVRLTEIDGADAVVIGDEK